MTCNTMLSNQHEGPPGDGAENWSPQNILNAHDRMMPALQFKCPKLRETWDPPWIFRVPRLDFLQDERSCYASKTFLLI